MRIALLLVVVAACDVGPSFTADALFPATVDDGGPEPDAPAGDVDPSQEAGGEAGADGPLEVGHGDAGTEASQGEAGKDAEPTSDAAACDGSAQTVKLHDDGEGQLWADCVPLGTYDATEATRACEAYGDGALCVPDTLGDGSLAIRGPAGSYFLWWVYAGIEPGRVVGNPNSVWK